MIQNELIYAIKILRLFNLLLFPTIVEECLGRIADMTFSNKKQPAKFFTQYYFAKPFAHKSLCQKEICRYFCKQIVNIVFGVSTKKHYKTMIFICLQIYHLGINDFTDQKDLILPLTFVQNTINCDSINLRIVRNRFVHCCVTLDTIALNVIVYLI